MERRYKYEIKKEDGIYRIYCKAEFNYKGEDLEAQSIINSNEPIKEITAEIKRELRQEVDKAINNYKLKN